jgi:DoxX-like family
VNIPSIFRSTRSYWIVTAGMCLFIAGGALFDVAKTDDVVKLITDLGYPEYLIRFLGVLKLAGVVAIISNRFPRLKHWAYAGLVFDTAGAMYSYFRIGSPITDWIPAFVGLLLVLASYGLYVATLDPITTRNAATP